MRSRLVLSALLLLATGICLWLSGVDHASVKALLDARSADGDVESYTSHFHGTVVRNLKWASVLSVLAVVLLAVLRKKWDRTISTLASDVRTFCRDAKAFLPSIWRSMGSTERVLVISLLVVGVVLRIRALNGAMIYDEAFTCTYYAVRPWYIIISDYSYPNNHILHTLLVKASMVVFGWGEAQARMPALIAGIAAIFLAWCWLRSQFNGYTAIIGSLLVAVAPSLVEYSALARGYSFTWVAVLLSLLLAGYFLRMGNTFSLWLLALVNALGLWTVPTMIYASLTVYAWIGLCVLRDTPRHERSNRLWKVIASGVLMIAFTVILYAPVLIVYGPGQLFYDETMGPRSWARFGESLKSLGTSWLNAPAAWLLTLLAALAASFSRSYRRLVAALTLGIVPLVLIQHMVGPPRIWSFALFVLLPGAAVAIDHLAQRTARSGWGLRYLLPVLILVVFVWSPRANAPLNRFTGAREAARWFKTQLAPTDRVLVNVPCEAPLEFYFEQEGLGITPLYRTPQSGGTLWFVLGTNYDHTFEALAYRARLPAGSWDDPRPVRELDGIAIFAARYGL